MKKLILLFCIITINIFAQNYFIKGHVKDKESNSSLSFATIRVEDTQNGTTSNVDGDFVLRLKSGSYKLTASFLGYQSDTIVVNLNSNIDGIGFYLKPSRIGLQEIVVHPGENPALRIIQAAIKRKNQIKSYVQNYISESYTKATIKTLGNLGIGGNSNSVSLSMGAAQDTSKLVISGILENESREYFVAPNNKKQIILAQRQTANLSSQMNTITGGRLNLNFYDDNINLFGKELPSPLSDKALNFYFFYIKDQITLNNKLVYKLFLSPDYESDAGFNGYIYIADSTYDLLKVELSLNRAANRGGLFDSFYIAQRFESYKDSILMPANLQISTLLNVFGITKIGFDFLTSVNDYKINTEVDQSIFNKAIIVVNKDAEQKDSIYWVNVQGIPYDLEEKSAYQRLDSLNKIQLTFWDKFNLLSGGIELNDHFSISGPLAMYHFNKVESHAVDFSIFGNSLLDERLKSSLDFSYGFGDKKVKEAFSSELLLGELRTHKISLNIFNRLNQLFENSVRYNELTTTLISLISKYDFNDYYYSRGFNIDYVGQIFPIANLKLGFENNTFKNAKTNSNVTWFYKERSFSANEPIYETKLNIFKIGLNFDFRNYIEDKYTQRRINYHNFNIFLNMGVDYSNHNALNSQLDFTKYYAQISGNLKTFRNNELIYQFNTIYNSGNLPYQLYYSLPGNIELTSKKFSFRTLGIDEYVSDRSFTAFLDYNFSDELFKFLHLPLLKDSEIQLNLFLNTAITDVSKESRNILFNKVKTFNKPFYEIGFGISHILIPISLEFAWKLNYFGDRNFTISINSFLINQ